MTENSPPPDRPAMVSRAFRNGWRSGVIQSFHFALTHTDAEVRAEFKRRFPAEFKEASNKAPPRATASEGPRPNSPEDIGGNAVQGGWTGADEPDMDDLGKLGAKLWDAHQDNARENLDP